MSKVKSPILTHTPNGSNISDKTASYTIKIVDLENIINNNIQKYIKKIAEIENFIATINDSELRQIITLRSLKDLKWEEIGQKLNMDRTTASKKFHKFFKNQ